MNNQRTFFICRFLIASLLLCVSFSSYSQKQAVWLDADTGNEVDDVYAIIRLLNEQSVDIVGLSSAHFNNPDLLVFEKWNQYPTTGISTIDISQELNEDILLKMNRTEIPCYKGADRQIGRAWGGFEPRDSEAVQQLVAYVKTMKEGEKLDVLILGAFTNLASAIILHPEIIPHIKCYVLGARYDASTGIWDKNEFNIRNDLNAFDYLLGQDIDLIIMPITTVMPYVFRKDETFARLPKDIPSHRLLKDRWEETEPHIKQRVMWDLALVEAYLKPEYAKIERRLGPPENGERYVSVYVSIDADALYDDFWKYTD
jgi:Inosine-uridine nucleoside N-ribohydrolase